MKRIILVVLVTIFALSIVGNGFTADNDTTKPKERTKMWNNSG